MKNLYFLLFVLFSAFISNTAFSQDSTRYEVFDVVYLTDGTVLRGQILSYDAQGGGLSFRDTQNRVYNFSREQYKYFREKQNFPINTNKNRALRPRKTGGLSYNIGINNTYLYGLEKLDLNALGNRRSTEGFAIGVQGTIGKYFTRSHYIGACAELGVLTTDPGFYNFGLHYNYEYDLKQTNLARYVPVELKFQNMVLQNSGIPYVETTPNSSWSGYYYPKTELKTLVFSVGHGFGFILEQGGSFNIDLSYQRHITLSQTFYGLKPVDAVGYDPKFQVNGFKLGLSLSF